MLYIRNGKVITPSRDNRSVVVAVVVAGTLAIGFGGVSERMATADHVIRTVVQVQGSR